VEIYIAVFAGLLSTLLLGVVYLADRYEREPIELIQNSFLAGLVVQLAAVFGVTLAVGPVVWSGWWLMATAVGVAVMVPFQVRSRDEMDERFDGVVYTVAFAGGATCVIHLNNLPSLIAASPFKTALESGAEPDLRDLLILAESTGFGAELGQGLVVILSAVFVGAVLGALQMKRTPPWRIVSATLPVAAIAIGIDIVANGAWLLRAALAIAAVGVSAAIKRRSVFRSRPQVTENEALVTGLKTILVVFGAALLATVLLQAVVERPEPIDELDGTGAAAGPRDPGIVSP
jgi:hypothetical protein